jgi:hypothetical protein
LNEEPRAAREYPLERQLRADDRAAEVHESSRRLTASGSSWNAPIQSIPASLMIDVPDRQVRPRLCPRNRDGPPDAVPAARDGGGDSCELHGAER